MSAMAADAGSVLIVEDDTAVGKVLAALLSQRGFESRHVASGPLALAALEARPFDVVISDLRMPEMDGMQLLKEVALRWPGLPFILLTAHGSIPVAVEAMKAGAVDFMLKPFERDEVVYVVEKALVASRKVAEESPRLAGTDLIGASPVMRDLYVTLKKVAAGPSTVLVRGETGTGKELVARAIHENSARKAGPFVRVHCAALPDTLLESELFGHEKGAFTGAVTRKPGRVELAHQGTLFLDEIGDITPAVQVKLLRVLQERELERLGGTQTIKVDVRFVAATHRDLEAMVAAGQFREDLFYRLNVVPLFIPPLRDRREDIEILARHFCAVHGRANARPSMALDAAAIARLRDQPWRGNVRQLQNFVERLVVMADGDRIGVSDVDRELGRQPLAASPPPVKPQANAELTLDSNRRDAERDALERALKHAGNNRTLAARLLDVSRRTLYNKLKEHGLE
jgi:DNA-binding NtrC family response regulator